MSIEQQRDKFLAWCARNEYDRTQRLDGSGFNHAATVRAWAAWQEAISTSGQEARIAELEAEKAGLESIVVAQASTISELRAAAAAAQEPVAEVVAQDTQYHGHARAIRCLRGMIEPGTKLYGAPQPAEPVVKESLTVAEPVKVQRVPYDIQELRNRVMSAIYDHGSKEPEDDETWESWHAASYDLLSSAVGDLFVDYLTTPPADGQAQQDAYKDSEDFHTRAPLAELGAWQRGWDDCRAHDEAEAHQNADSQRQTGDENEI